MKHRINPLAAAIAIAFSLPAFAQNSLEQIDVRAQKLEPLPQGDSLRPSSISSRSASTDDTAVLLSETPGVSIYTAGGVSGLPAIHGLADDRLRIKVDGMDLIAACPNHMNSALSYIDPSQIGSLIVYPGITPVSLGGDSIGGTIVAETKTPAFAAPGEGILTKGELGGRYRSNGNAQSFNAGATIATENFSISYNGATAKSDNYTAGDNFKNYTASGRVGHDIPRDEVASTAYETRNHLLTLAMRSDNHLLEAKVGYQDIPYELYPNQRMDMLGNEQTRSSLRYLGQFNWGKLEARAYHEEVDHFMDFGADKRYWYGTASNLPNSINGQPCSPISASCAAGMPMYTASLNSGLTLKGDIALNENSLLRIGTELQRYRLDDWWPASGGGMWPNTFQNINQGQRDRSAAFGEWESQLDSQWSVIAGARYELVKTNAGAVHGYNDLASSQAADLAAFNNSDRERKDHNWDFSLVARYHHDANLDIEFGLAQKTRSPNLYERYSWSAWSMAAGMNNFVGDGNGYVGNPDLKPEKAHTLSATFDWHAPDRNWEFKATPFFTRVTDYIDAIKTNTYVDNQFNVLQYANQSARLYGLDLSGHVPLGSTEFGKFGLKGLMNYTRGENRDTGSGLYNIMPLNARIALTHQTGGWDNAVEAVAALGKHDISEVRNEIETAAYSLINLRASYSWGKARVDFGVENLFDKFYYLPLGGAYLGQGKTMSMSTGPTWGTGVPGMGRSFYAGLNYKF